MIDFSILICTYNGSKTILTCLKAIKNINYPKKHFELIVVDNNSKDETRNIVLDFINENPEINATFLSEKEQGKSFAFKTGIKKTIGKYIITCDDDNFLNSEYLNVAKDIFNSNPNVGVLGGYGILNSDTAEIPKWVYSFQRYFACGAQHIKQGDVSSQGSLWGAGMVFDATVFRKLINAGFENILSCRKGNELSSGGDIEYCRWFLLAKKRLWYSEKLIYTHFVTSDRFNEDYISRLTDSFELVSEVIYKYDLLIRKSKIGFLESLFNMIKLIFEKDTSFTKANLELGFCSLFWTFDKDLKSIKKAKHKFDLI